MQPGSFDADILEWAKGAWPGACVGGLEGCEERGEGEGWCVLVDGERGLRMAGKL